MDRELTHQYGKGQLLGFARFEQSLVEGAQSSGLTYQVEVFIVIPQMGMAPGKSGISDDAPPAAR
jgi:hypothetical protein